MKNLHRLGLMIFILGAVSFLKENISEGQIIFSILLIFLGGALFTDWTER